MTGVLFTSRHGRQSAVGIVRPDQLEPAIQIEARTGFWLSFGQYGALGSSGESESWASRVVGLTLAKPTEALYSMYIQGLGRLEWWYSYRQRQVHFREQQSPEPRM